MQAIDLHVFQAMPGNNILLLPDAPLYTIVAATDSYTQTSGRSRNSLVGKGLFQAFPNPPDESNPNSVSTLRHSIESAIAERKADKLPIHRYDIEIADGEYEERYWSAVNIPIYNSAGELIYILHTAEDVTDEIVGGRKLLAHQHLEDAYKRIKESEEKYRSLFSSMDQGFCVMDVLFDAENNPYDYRFVEINPVFEKQTGLKNAIGKTAKELVPDLEAHWFQLYGKVAVSGEATHFTEKSDAMGRWFDVYAFKMGGVNSRKVALLFTDITERNRSEEALKQSENNLRNTILQAPVAMAILKGPEFVVELANEPMYELWGKGKEELLGKSIFSGLPEVRDQGYEALLTSVYNTGERFVAQGIPVTLPRNGGTETLYINLLYEAFREPDGSISGVMAVASDVTEQVTARLKVEASNNEFQFVTDFLPQLIWVTLPNGYHYYYNKQWYDYTGLPPGETEGYGWKDVFHPDDQDKAWNVWQQSLESGEPYEIEYRCRRHDGTFRWFLGRALPLRDASGEILKWFGTCTDIDDQKRSAEIMEHQVEERTRELRIVNEQLQRFAYSASHDLQEPLRKITYFVERLLSNLGTDLSEENQKMVQRIQQTSRRMRTLIDDLLDYSNTTLGATGFEEVALSDIVQTVLHDMEATIIENGAQVQYEQLPNVKGDARQLRQLFQNLVSNAVKYHNKEGEPQINITSQVVHGNSIEANIPADLKRHQFHLIEVSDNGIGFEPQYAKQIFGLFHRLHGKSEFAGTGVGLAIVQKVVENHHGYIWADSQPGLGSSFKVLLPAE